MRGSLAAVQTSPKKRGMPALRRLISVHRHLMGPLEDF